MNITKLVGREIYDSRGLPTIECDLYLEDGLFVTSSVPSGLSCSPYEVSDMRDGGSRLMGLGVRKALENLETIIAPTLIGKEPEFITMDLGMLELDGTANKSHLGANAMLAASIAVCRAQSMLESTDLYEFIARSCGIESVSMPLPMFNILNGGVHANNDIPIQEFMIMPAQAKSFRESLEIAVTIYQTLKSVLNKKGLSTAVGDEGGFAPHLTDETQALDLLMEAIALSGVDNAESVVIALDVAATQFYNPKTGMYSWQGKQISTDELLQKYMTLSENYPIYSIEDGFAVEDIHGWHNIMQAVGGDLQIVGDDLFATSAERIEAGMEHNYANAAIIKPNQVGTVTETLQAIKLCKANNFNIIISNRSGETNDTFIADLAVGVNASQIKAGGCSRGERMSKYNHLLRIEDGLMNAVMGL